MVDAADFLEALRSPPGNRLEALLSQRRAIDDWHDYRNKATERALRDWCELHSIEITD
jgi:hypothetical protein